jgi:hypothetical protein
MANEIVNRLQAMAVIQVQSSSNFRFVSQVGFRGIVRKNVGIYNLLLVDPLDYMVPVATVPFVERYRGVPEAYNLFATGMAIVGGVPLDVVPGGNEPGSLALAFYSDIPPNTLADSGLCLIKVWQFPTIE